MSPSGYQLPPVLFHFLFLYVNAIREFLDKNAYRGSFIIFSRATIVPFKMCKVQSPSQPSLSYYQELIVIGMVFSMSVEFEFAILNLPHVWRFFSIALMMHSDFIFVNIYVQGDNFKIVI